MNKIKLTLIFFLYLLSFLLSKDDKTIDFSRKIDSLRYLSFKFPERGIRYAREILEQSYDGKPHPLEHKILNSLGEIYLELGLHTEALTYFIDAEAQIKLNARSSSYGYFSSIRIKNCPLGTGESSTINS